MMNAILLLDVNTLM
jgi:hypothetical protein